MSEPKFPLGRRVVNPSWGSGRVVAWWYDETEKCNVYGVLWDEHGVADAYGAAHPRMREDELKIGPPSGKFPVHHRDDGLYCDQSGQPRATPTTPCRYGCGGAHEHYANDGHPECEDT